MGGDTGGLREEIRRRLSGAGALKVGFANAAEVDAAAWGSYEDWLDAGREAGMRFMHNHKGIRRNPRLLLAPGGDLGQPGAQEVRTLVCMAFSYVSPSKRDERLPLVSEYAWLPDYHVWIRGLIRQSGVGELLGEEGRDWRICVDSAPVMERYWARKAGLGIIGRNGMLILPGIGSRVLLAEIATTLDLESDSPISGDCGSCEACLKACPAGALRTDSTIDCNLCLSYLTIEHRGEWTDPRHLKAMQSPQGHHTLFGCDRCVLACPHNNDHAAVAPVQPQEDILGLETSSLLAGEGVNKTSCLRRARKDDLMRNARNASTEGVSE